MYVLPPFGCFCLQVHGATVLPQLRHRCLASLVRMLYFASPELLAELLKDVPISSFIAGILLGRDVRSAAYAMQMAELLMQKLPGTFAAHFVKEGVAHALAQLSGAGGAAAGGAAAGGGVGVSAVGSEQVAAASSTPSAPTTRVTRRSAQVSVRVRVGRVRVRVG